jgi:hypothetical protein
MSPKVIRSALCFCATAVCATGVALLTLAGCSSVGLSPSSLPGSPDLPGRQVYIAKCARCHKLYDPKRYNDEEWRTWMGKMSRKAKLTPEQEQQVSAYVAEFLRSTH